MSGLIQLIIFVAIIGLIVWVVLKIVPMPSPFRVVIMAIAGLICLLLLLDVLTGSSFVITTPFLRGS